MIFWKELAAGESHSDASRRPEVVCKSLRPLFDARNPRARRVCVYALNALLLLPAKRPCHSEKLQSITLRRTEVKACLSKDKLASSKSSARAIRKRLQEHSGKPHCSVFWHSPRHRQQREPAPAAWGVSMAIN